MNRQFLVLSLMLLAAASASKAEALDKRFAVVKLVFDDSKYIDCAELVELTEKECKYYKGYIAFVAADLYKVIAYRSDDKKILLERGILPRFLSDEDKYREFSDAQSYIINRLTRDNAFYDFGAPLMSHCLRSSRCGSVIQFSSRTHEQWADIWDRTIPFFRCVDSRDSTKDLHQDLEIVGQNRFEQGRIGRFPDCVADGVPSEAFKIVSRIYHDASKF